MKTLLFQSVSQTRIFEPLGQLIVLDQLTIPWTEGGGGSARARTEDRPIKSRMLYQLSY